MAVSGISWEGKRVVLPRVGLPRTASGFWRKSCSDDRTVRVWNVATGQVEQTLVGHSDFAKSVVFSPDGSKLASGDGVRTLRVWNVATGQVERTLEGHSEGICYPVDSVLFSPDV